MVCCSGHRLEPNDLLPGETLVVSKRANAWVKPSDYGLSMLAVSIGILRLLEGCCTSQTTAYCSSLTPRIVLGEDSVFSCRRIVSIRDSSKLIAKRITVSTRTNDFQFVIWGIREFIDAVQKLKMDLTQMDIPRVRTLILQNFDKWGEGLQVFGGLEALNKMLLNLTQSVVKDLAKSATNPMEALGAMALESLVSTSETKHE